jgi:ferritin
MNKAIEEALNKQINAEMSSAYLYLSMAAHFEAERLPGFARWMRLQAKEELGHGMQFYDHLVDRGGRVSLAAIDRPPSEFGTPLAALERVLEHEQGVTSAIHALYELTDKEGDHASRPFLLSFISEQVEEEKTAAQIVDQLRMVGDQRGPLLFIDRHLGKRSS